MGAQEVEPNSTVNSNGGSNTSLGKKIEGLARPAQALRSQASGCLEPADQGGRAALVEVPSREDGVQTHDHECTHVTVSHSPNQEPPLWTEVIVWGYPYLWKATGKGPSPSTKGGKHRCEGGEQEGLKSAETS